MTVTAYDGKLQQVNGDREQCELGPNDPNIGITKESLARVQLENEIWPLLCAHGIVPTVNKPARPDRLPSRHTIEEFESRGEVNHAGIRCLLFKTDPVASIPLLTDEFWVDPARESAIIRQVYWSGKNPWLRFDTNFQKSKDGWLPTSWTYAHSAEVSRLSVERIDLDPAITDADFVLPTPPGSIVSVQTFPEAGQGLDPNKPSNGTFRVDSAGKWISLDKAKGFTTGEGQQLPPASPDRRWLWWGGFALLGVVGISTVVVRYRRRNRQFS